MLCFSDGNGASKEACNSGHRAKALLLESRRRCQKAIAIDETKVKVKKNSGTIMDGDRHGKSGTALCRAQADGDGHDASRFTAGVTDVHERTRMRCPYTEARDIHGSQQVGRAVGGNG